MSFARIDDRLDVRLLRYFVVVAEELHFARAAARLGIAQPPLSQQIKRLEQLVGVALFERTSRRVALTDAGAALLAATHRGLQELAAGLDAAQAVAAGRTGSIAIGYAHLATFLLPPLVRAFRRQHPRVSLTLHGVPTTTQLEWLKAGELDAAFVSNTAPDADLLIHHRWLEPLVHVRARSAIGADELILFPRQQSPPLYDLIVRTAEDAGLPLASVQEADSWYTIACLVAAGLGYTIAPRALRQYRVPGLEYRKLQNDHAEASVALVTRAERLSLPLQEFVKQVRVSAPGRR